MLHYNLEMFCRHLSKRKIFLANLYKKELEKDMIIGDIFRCKKISLIQIYWNKTTILVGNYNKKRQAPVTALAFS